MKNKLLRIYDGVLDFFDDIFAYTILVGGMVVAQIFNIKSGDE